MAAEEAVRVPVDDRRVLDLAQDKISSPEPGQSMTQPIAPADGSAPIPRGTPTPGRMHVFISYAHEDRDTALELRRTLEKGGLEVFIDTESLRSGVQWPPALRRAIALASRFLLVWSVDAANSDWVRKEYTYALDLRRDWDDPFIQIERLDATGLPEELKTIQAAPPQKTTILKPAHFVLAALAVAAATTLLALRLGTPRIDPDTSTASKPLVETAMRTNASTANPVPPTMLITEPPRPSVLPSNTTVLPAPSLIARQTSTRSSKRQVRVTPSASTQASAAPSSSTTLGLIPGATRKTCAAIIAACDLEHTADDNLAAACKKREGC